MSIDANWAEEEWRHDCLATDHDDYDTPTRAEAERDAADATDRDET